MSNCNVDKQKIAGALPIVISVLLILINIIFVISMIRVPETKSDKTIKGMEDVFDPLGENYSSVGIRAVECLYDFETLVDLAEHDAILKELCTPEVYEQITIDNEGRLLSTYLKFNNTAVSVEILDATNKYVLYTLHTDALEEGRQFMFVYNLNKDKKISEVKEMEVIPFS